VDVWLPSGGIESFCLTLGEAFFQGFPWIDPQLGGAAVVLVILGLAVWVRSRVPDRPVSLGGGK